MGYRCYLTNKNKESDFVCLGKLYGYCNDLENIDTQLGLKYLNQIGKFGENDCIIYCGGFNPIELTKDEAKHFFKWYQADAKNDGWEFSSEKKLEVESFIDKTEKILLDFV